MPDQVASLVTDAMRVPEGGRRSASSGAARLPEGNHVEGFRGIGPKITHTLQPGPGLVVATGHNGSASQLRWTPGRLRQNRRS